MPVCLFVCLFVFFFNANLILSRISYRWAFGVVLWEIATLGTLTAVNNIELTERSRKILN